uniref:Uncharacterized protein n=1 Tax=Eutreptiella gymnastica TaxID=73025 RepID=A0A7S1NMJ3_9EUGL
MQESMVHGHEGIANTLLFHGAVLDHEVAQFYLWRGIWEGDLRLVQHALRYGPEGLMDAVSDVGDRPVFVAVRLRKMAIARWLIAYGADTTGTDIDGNTISDMALRRGVPGFCEIDGDEEAAHALEELWETINALKVKMEQARAELILVTVLTVFPWGRILDSYRAILISRRTQDSRTASAPHPAAAAEERPAPIEAHVGDRQASEQRERVQLST